MPQKCTKFLKRQRTDAETWVESSQDHENVPVLSLLEQPDAYIYSFMFESLEDL